VGEAVRIPVGVGGLGWKEAREWEGGGNVITFFKAIVFLNIGRKATVPRAS
jgi:hypothetical protein